MRSAIFVGPGQPLMIEERPIPVPRANQALIKVARCGICTSDIHMTSGSAFDFPGGTALGHEYAGEVVAVGADGRLAIGDRITALPLSGCGTCEACLRDSPLHCSQLRSMAGGYSEYTLVDERMAIRLPQAISFTEGALIEPLAATLRGVRKLSITPETRVAVIGVGAIGASAIFWARRQGAGRIVALARTMRSEDLARTLGAQTLVTTGEGLDHRLHDALGGPPHIVIEAAGAQGALQQAIDIVSVGGTIVSLGGCIHGDTILPVLAMWKEVRILFSVAYGLSEFRHAAEILGNGAIELQAMIGETIGLGALPDRFETMRHSAHAAKIMVDPQAA